MKTDGKIKYYDYLSLLDDDCFIHVRICGECNFIAMGNKNKIYIRDKYKTIDFHKYCVVRVKNTVYKGYNYPFVEIVIKEIYE